MTFFLVFFPPPMRRRRVLETRSKVRGAGRVRMVTSPWAETPSAAGRTPDFLLSNPNLGGGPLTPVWRRRPCC